MLRRIGFFVFASLAMSLWLGSAQALNFESIFMPGKLIQGHAKYEEQCKKCHSRFEKGHQAGLCLDCHKKVKEDVKADKGFHGRISGIKTRECSDCHTEHQGRGVDITRLNPTTFRHDKTDFPLKGRHQHVSCVDCHKKHGLYRKAPSACIACHKKDDAHGGKLGKKCEKCHVPNGWRKESRFDHSKTDFPLRGKHKDTSCRACHPNERYTKVAMACYDCHRINDKHRGVMGRKCKDCHSEKDWKKQRFSHDKDTKFPLHGRHQKLRCEACHETNVYKEDLGQKCFDCHQKDDEHKGRYGKKCADCHGEKRWDKVKFDHQKDTHFPLRGRHKDVHCSVCHKKDIHAKLGKKCIDCHRLNDVHKGKLGKSCQRCHDERDWARRIRFDHGLTRFPLLGLHALAPCEECHLSQDFGGTERRCFGCHKEDDEHKQRLGTECGDCHNPNDWGVWHFDHNRQSRFKLEGRHKRVDCYACHIKPMEKDVVAPTSCYRCHADDDIHRGSFGHRCEKCHVSSSFKDVEFSR